MNLDIYRTFSETNLWQYILPEIALAVFAILLLIMGMIVPRREQGIISRLAVWGQWAILVYFLIFEFWQNLQQLYLGKLERPEILFGGMLTQTFTFDVMRVFFMLCGIFVSYMGSIYLKKHKLPTIEFYFLTIIITAGLMLLAQSSHFVMLFVALETVTVAFYVLIAYCRTSVFSLEAGVKYLILGGLSSAMLLFGIVLLYGAATNPEVNNGLLLDRMGFNELGSFIFAHKHDLMVQAGAVLVLCGVAFKIGAIPFQIWIPDVYQGAPTPVTALLACASKAGGFILLLNLIRGPFAGLEYMVKPLLIAVAIVTILFGNLTAVSQQNVKRMMGLSGIAHAGYLLMGVVAGYTVAWADKAVLFYLFCYLFASLAVFMVMTFVANENDEAQTLDDYTNLYRNQPYLAGILGIGLGSLAGIPPLAGFMGKLLLFIATFKAGLFTLLAVAIVGVVISIYYYFGWAREVFFTQWLLKDETPVNAQLGTIVVSPLYRFLLGMLAAVVIIIGIYQGNIGFYLFM